MKKSFLICAALVSAGILFTSCGQTPPDLFENPGDMLGGGGTVEQLPELSESTLPDDVQHAEADEEAGSEGVLLPEDGKISAAGAYKLTGAFEGKISVSAENVRLILDNASLKNDKKVIESDYALTITLIGQNSLENTNAEEGKNAVDCAGLLTVNGSGSLKILSQKNAIKADAIAVTGASLDLTAQSDGLHAEISAYDGLTSPPIFSYDSGYVLLDGATVKASTVDDCIQADTFVYIKGESVLDLTSNGGAPQTITEFSSDNGDGKGIKAGALDWGAEDAELADAGYLIAIESGTVTVNSNDDAIHSDGDLILSGGTLSLTAGDDALHCEKLLTVTGGEVTVHNCYEGVEGAKVEISGGKLNVTAVDDGINGADGTQSMPGRPNSNCHIIISGGEISVDAEGDGVDSNGSILISGGKLFVSGSSRGDNAALDADGGILVNGGYVFAVGALGMVETPAANSGQNVLSYASRTAIAAGTLLALMKDGEEIFSYETVKSCQSVILSCPELANGESFALFGSGTQLVEFTVQGVITAVGSAGGNGPQRPQGPQGPQNPRPGGRG